ncbi:MAG: NAD(P)-dependent oxidoreductase [Gammaproteobacteria bacterium]
MSGNSSSSCSAMKTGIIGLGAMGAGMALNLDRAGYLYAVWNRTRSKADVLAVQTAASVTDSPAELAADCELIIICVSRDEDVLEMIHALLPGIKADTVVVDTSTVSADTAVQAAALLADKQAGFLDCPVSGGVEGAQQGTLAVMAGGEAATLQRVRAVLEAISSRITLVGPVGSGQACKAVNQIICAGLYESVAEALAFGKVLGLDLNKVVEVVAGGAAANWVLDNRSDFMLDESFPPGFKVNLHLKDLAICLRMAQAAGIKTLPLTELAIADYQRLIEQGHGEEDTSSVYRLKGLNS